MKQQNLFDIMKKRNGESSSSPRIAPQNTTNATPAAKKPQGPRSEQDAFVAWHATLRENSVVPQGVTPGSLPFCTRAPLQETAVDLPTFAAWLDEPPQMDDDPHTMSGFAAVERVEHRLLAEFNQAASPSSGSQTATATVATTETSSQQHAPHSSNTMSGDLRARSIESISAMIRLCRDSRNLESVDRRFHASIPGVDATVAVASPGTELTTASGVSPVASRPIPPSLAAIQAHNAMRFANPVAHGSFSGGGSADGTSPTLPPIQPPSGSGTIMSPKFLSKRALFDDEGDDVKKEEDGDDEDEKLLMGKSAEQAEQQQEQQQGEAPDPMLMEVVSELWSTFNPDPSLENEAQRGRMLRPLALELVEYEVQLQSVMSSGAMASSMWASTLPIPSFSLSRFTEHRTRVIRWLNSWRSEEDRVVEPMEVFKEQEAKAADELLEHAEGLIVDDRGMRQSIRQAKREAKIKKEAEEQEAERQKVKGYFGTGDALEQGSLSNIAAISGACGVGKTALVYAAAAHSGYRVLEINTSMRRYPKALEKLFQEATQSGQIKVAGNGMARAREEMARIVAKQEEDAAAAAARKKAAMEARFAASAKAMERIQAQQAAKEAADKAAREAAAATAAAAAPPPAEKPPAKRGRGRPKKQVVDADAEEDDAGAEKPKPKPKAKGKKAGGKKGAKKETEEDKKDESDDDDDAVKEITAEEAKAVSAKKPAPVGGRGRKANAISKDAVAAFFKPRTKPAPAVTTTTETVVEVEKNGDDQDAKETKSDEAKTSPARDSEENGEKEAEVVVENPRKTEAASVVEIEDEDEALLLGINKKASDSADSPASTAKKGSSFLEPVQPSFMTITDNSNSVASVCSVAVVEKPVPPQQQQVSKTPSQPSQARPPSAPRPASALVDVLKDNDTAKAPLTPPANNQKLSSVSPAKNASEAAQPAEDQKQFVLVLIESGDVLFEDESGFYPTIKRISKESKFPVIVTGNRFTSGQLASLGSHTPHAAMSGPTRFYLALQLFAVGAALQGRPLRGLARTDAHSLMWDVVTFLHAVPKSDDVRAVLHTFQLLAFSGAKEAAQRVQDSAHAPLRLLSDPSALEALVSHHVGTKRKRVDDDSEARWRQGDGDATRITSPVDGSDSLPVRAARKENLTATTSGAQDQEVTSPGVMSAPRSEESPAIWFEMHTMRIQLEVGIAAIQETQQSNKLRARMERSRYLGDMFASDSDDEEEKLSHHHRQTNGGAEEGGAANAGPPGAEEAGMAAGREVDTDTESSSDEDNDDDAQPAAFAGQSKNRVTANVTRLGRYKAFETGYRAVRRELKCHHATSSDAVLAELGWHTKSFNTSRPQTENQKKRRRNRD